ncbi:MAG: DegQ family serine endoprotease [Candidatus Accumulibacter sp.]|jgi:serine protease Do|nr:DegQ family serine endoprotease [Accumulibacter sp.]
MKIQMLKKTLMAAALTAALSGTYSITARQGLWESHAVTPASATVLSTARAALPDMSEIVARNSPAVVNIAVSGKVRAQQLPDFPGIDPNDPFYEFFRHFRIPQQRGEQQVRGQGSGFIVRENGVILTNAHVINDADEVTVRLSDKREFKAKVLGADKASDVAVLKIEARNLPTVTIGNSANTRVGEWVLAIGSPYGFESSATAGIVSAKSRSLPDDNYVPFIQTDVAVNPGNSGGPLFNMNGEVIGINSQIYSRTGGYQGLSFAIPIDVAVSIQDQILKHGKVQRGRLGVSIQAVDQSLAESFGLSKPTGALISSVEKGSPAAQAGLEPGDVILSVNGKEIESSNELPPVIAGIVPGDSARLQIWRKGGTRKIDVKVGGTTLEKTANADEKDAGPDKLGLALRPLRPEESRQLDGRIGLLVENASGAAARAGIRPGDVVLSVNGEAVSSTGQLRALLAKASKRVALLIQRGEATLFVPVDLG